VGNITKTDKRFLNYAKKEAEKSKDPSTQVGAVIVTKENEIVSKGYNSFVTNASKSAMTWDRPMKYHLVVHAEMNALISADRSDLSDCKLYITHAPCSNCLKHVLQSGIREIYVNELGPGFERGTLDDLEAVCRMLAACKVKCQVCEEDDSDCAPPYEAMVMKKLIKEGRLKGKSFGAHSVLAGFQEDRSWVIDLSDDKIQEEHGDEPCRTKK